MAYEATNETATIRDRIYQLSFKGNPTDECETVEVASHLAEPNGKVLSKTDRLSMRGDDPRLVECWVAAGGDPAELLDTMALIKRFAYAVRAELRTPTEP